MSSKHKPTRFALYLGFIGIVALSACSDSTTSSTTVTDMGDEDTDTDTASEATCGDGTRTAPEVCDDGNTADDDGCAADCAKIEDGWSCPTSGPCVEGAVCGDGNQSSDEACDDANQLSGDGCSEDCQTIEQGWSCPSPGVACVATACGDRFLAGTEGCDDGNPNDGDGCTSACTVEAGWVCLATGECIAQQCGDGILAGEETCDDGNTEGDDGCAADCMVVEPNFICPTPNQACQSTVVCGDRRLGPTEDCDDGNTASGDGCSNVCEREVGWSCPAPGARCRAEQCGDGILAGTETCDDSNTNDNDGCSNVCQVEQGWACPAAMSCYETTCGDGLLEGTEQCDDNNVRPFDGCSQSCTNEPQCSGGTCTAICGDGIILPGTNQEACDDGNTSDGDGCSTTCAVEAGWSCTVQPEPLPNTIVLPLVIRDFKGIQWYADDTTSYGHPDFNDPNDGNGSISFGILQSTLINGRPKLAYVNADPNDTTGLPKSSARFDEWYDSSSPWNIEEIRYLTLPRDATDTYKYDSTTDGFVPFSVSGFFPVDDGGWIAQGSESLQTANATVNDGGNHNFNFTTETRFYFQYEGTEVLNFSGDDDMWVFIDGLLCLDVGGLHGALAATMNLADPTLETNTTQRSIVSACKAQLDSLVTAANPKPLVEMVIFHAERHTNASNFKLDLRGFVKQTSSCEEACGNGVVTIGEVCDDGVNDGSYGGCASDCLSMGGYCGDGTLEGPEACDNGVNFNDGRYGGCNPDCTFAGTCGDGIVQSRNEVCDDGVNDGSYNGCSADCQIPSARCGDGEVNGPEACDLGVGQNLGGYNGCNPDCTLAPYCGDGIRQGAEQCDDGNNDESDGCTHTCIRAIL